MSWSGERVYCPVIISRLINAQSAAHCYISFTLAVGYNYRALSLSYLFLSGPEIGFTPALLWIRKISQEIGQFMEELGNLRVQHQRNWFSMVFKIEKTSASQRQVGPSQSGCRRVSIECIVPHYYFYSSNLLLLVYV